jgi:hypothetical protein
MAHSSDHVLGDIAAQVQDDIGDTVGMLVGPRPEECFIYLFQAQQLSFKAFLISVNTLTGKFSHKIRGHVFGFFKQQI